MKGQPNCDVLHGLVVERWGEYALPRFGEGTRAEPGGRAASRRAAEMAWSAFIERSYRLYAEQRRIAHRVGGELDFEIAHLQLLLLRGLVKGCEFCGAVYGVHQADAIWSEHPHRFSGADGVKGQRAARNRRDAQQMLRLSNLLPACARCARAIDLLTASVFRDVLMALRAEPEWVAARWLDRASGRGSSLPPPPASNALAATLAQAPRGKKGLSTR